MADRAIQALNEIEKVSKVDLTDDSTNDRTIEEDMKAREEDTASLSDNDQSDYEFTADDKTFTLIDEATMNNEFELISDRILLDHHSNQLTTISSSLKPIIRSNVEPETWKQETERLLPQLQLGPTGSRTDIRSDWRWRLTEVNKRRLTLSNELNESSGRLNRLHENVQRSIQRLASRERHVQQQLATMVDEWSALRIRERKAAVQYQQTNGGVLDKSRKLAELSERVQQIRHQVEQQAAKLTDGAPLATLRSRVRDLRLEIDSFDVRIAVAGRSLLQVRVQQATESVEAAASVSLISGLIGAETDHSNKKKGGDRKMENTFLSSIAKFPSSITQRSLL